MLLLLIASIRLIRPMAFSGAIGFVSSSSSEMSLSVAEIDCVILSLSSVLSLTVMLMASCGHMDKTNMHIIAVKLLPKTQTI